ncbi:fatty-acyl-CoA synthase [Bradyrhizobium sp. LM2.7]
MIKQRSAGNLRPVRIQDRQLISITPVKTMSQPEKKAAFDTSVKALAAIAESHPNKEAFAFPAETISFRDLSDKSTALAKALLDLGFKPQENIALLAQNSIHWLIVQLAVAKAGMVLVPLNTYYKVEDLTYALSHSQARAIFFTPAFRTNKYLELVQEATKQGKNNPTKVIIGGGAEQCLSIDDLIAQGATSSTALPSVEGTDNAAIIYTSGTTGFPKGAMLTHEGVMANGRSIFSRLKIGFDDRVTSIVPMFHAASFCVGISGCLTVGATFLGIEAFDPVEMFEIIQGHRATVHIAVPTSLRMMLEHPRRREFDLSSLRVGTCGGADVEPDMLRRCEAEFPIPSMVQGYGLTESSGLACCPEVDDPSRSEAAGLPLPGYSIRVADPENGAILGHDAIGEVQVKSHLIMRGYFANDEETRKTIDADGWLKTGDLGQIRPDGKLVLAGGRLKDMIIRGGENIYPAEVERILFLHPAVTEVAVFGIKDEHFGEIVAAAVKCANVTAAELSDHCASRIAKYKIPTRYFRTEVFPLTPSGKIRKVALKEMATDGKLDVLV